jgi:hypothetical protein
MDANAYVGEVISCIVYFFVGVRLYLLSRRTGHAPETLIAVSFLLWTLSYVIWDIPYAFVESEELVPPIYSYVSLVALALGNVVFAFFIRAAFRGAARWAMWLVAAIALSNLAGVVGMGSTGDWEGTNPLANPWYWLECFGSFAPCVWMGAEGFSQYSKMRRRLKLGLCEPMACNRFLLWGITGTTWVVLETIVTVNDIAYALTSYWSEALGMAMALFEVLPVAVCWVVFFPPAFYSRWIEGSKSTVAEGTRPAS